MSYEHSGLFFYIVRDLSALDITWKIQMMGFL